MNPEVTDLRLGIVDESRTAESRELISAFAESKSFVPSGYYSSVDELTRALSGGELEAGLVVPSDFATKRMRGEVAEVQFLVDSVNSNTGSIAGGYAARVIGALNEKISLNKTSVQPARASSRVSLFYNPGLQNSWFIVTGMIGMLMVMLGSLVASSSMVKEKEVGTVEQLLMTPAGSAEIILAKMAPIFLLLSVDIGLSAVVGNFRLWCAVAWQSHAALHLGNVVCAFGHRHRHDHRDVHAFTTAGAVDEFLCQSAVVDVVRSDDADRSDAAVDAAADESESGETLRSAGARRDAEGRRARSALSKLPGPRCVHNYSGRRQRVALPQAVELMLRQFQSR